MAPGRMRTRTTAALLTVGLLLGSATACSGSSDEVTATQPSHSSSKRPAASPAAKTRPMACSSSACGTHWSDTDIDGSHISGTTSALSYTQPATDVDLPDEVSDFKNPTWAVLEVKVCADAKSSSVLVAQDPWALGFSDDTRPTSPAHLGWRRTRTRVPRGRWRPREGGNVPARKDHVLA